MESKYYRSRTNARGFALGYVEEIHVNQDNRLTLSKEGPAYMLRGFIRGGHIMEDFRTLAHARIHLAEYWQYADKET